LSRPHPRRIDSATQLEISVHFQVVGEIACLNKCVYQDLDDLEPGLHYLPATDW